LRDRLFSRRRRRVIRSLGFAVALLLSAVSALAEPVLVAHPLVSVNQLTVNTTRLMFSMQLDQWPDGNRVRVFVLPDDSAIHRAFSKDQLSLYPRQLRRVWDRQLYSGTGQVPETVGSETEMRRKIATTPGAVGYLPSAMIDETVNVLSIR